MALSATICKADLNIVDMDRHYYQQHSLTVAQHPSENDERLMIRLLAFALHADEFLSFTKGLSTDDEPDLWQKSLSGEIELWIELGLPSEKRLKKACGRAQQVILYTYGTGSAEQCAAAVLRQLDLGADGVILHGAAPTELAPTVEAYRTIRPAGRFDHLAANPAS